MRAESRLPAVAYFQEGNLIFKHFKNDGGKALAIAAAAAADHGVNKKTKKEGFERGAG